MTTTKQTLRINYFGHLVNHNDEIFACSDYCRMMQLPQWPEGTQLLLTVSDEYFTDSQTASFVYKGFPYATHLWWRGQERTLYLPLREFIQLFFKHKEHKTLHFTLVKQ